MIVHQSEFFRRLAGLRHRFGLVAVDAQESGGAVRPQNLYRGHYGGS